MTPEEYDAMAFGADRWPIDWRPPNLTEAVKHILALVPNREHVRQVLLVNHGNIFKSGDVEAEGRNKRDTIRADLAALAVIVGNGGLLLYKTTTISSLPAFSRERFPPGETAGTLLYDADAREAVTELQSYADPASAQVGVYDTAVATAGFEPLSQGSGQGKMREEMITSAAYLEIFWDACHYQPYVYNELNKLLLNQLCDVPHHGSSP